MRLPDGRVAARHAGEDDHLTVAASLRNRGPHALEPRVVGVAERVVEDHRRTALLRHEDRARKAREDAELLARATRELLERHRDLIERAIHDRELLAQVQRERRSEDQPT
ncbi:MAG: hypothetical protein FJ298_07870 [Planctomycetes bacterium]|nr:hypothetical protein [Planctomycetota bacterium]